MNDDDAVSKAWAVVGGEGRERDTLEFGLSSSKRDSAGERDDTGDWDIRVAEDVTGDGERDRDSVDAGAALSMIC